MPRPTSSAPFHPGDKPRISGFRLKDFRLLGRRLLLVLAAYAVSRAFFLLLNPILWQGATAGEIAQAFWLGLRFDVSTVCSVNAPFIVISLLPLPWRERLGWKRGLKIWFVLTNSFFLLTDLADAEYVKFTGRRTGVDILGILPDLMAQAPQLLRHYFYIPLLAAGLGYVLARLYSERIVSYRQLHWGLGIPAYLLCITLAVLGIRGSLELKPLAPGNAFALRPAGLGVAALNTPFVFFKSVEAEKTQQLTWAGTPEQALARFRQDPGVPPSPALPRYNVVVILLESFGTEYTGLEGGTVYTPFLDSLAHAGTWLPHFYANGRRSIEAVPAVFAQMPSLDESAFISGPYSANRIYGWPAEAAKAGYTTLFFHGGRNGTMGFDGFSGQAGFDRYIGLNEYPARTQDYDGNWGIFDRPFLQFVAGTLNQTRQPFVAGIFTLSSHQPYTIEPGFKDCFPKGTLPIHESLGYADMALRRFFATAARMPWYRNTLFVLTADHTQMSEQARFQTPDGLHDVPCILFAPGKKIALDTTQPRQHADIGPTVADLIGLKLPHPGPFASSMVRPAPSRVLTWGNGRYTLVNRNGYLALTPTGQAETTLPPSDTAAAARLLKAGAQVYADGLRQNRMYP